MPNIPHTNFLSVFSGDNPDFYKTARLASEGDGKWSWRTKAHKDVKCCFIKNKDRRDTSTVLWLVVDELKKAHLDSVDSKKILQNLEAYCERFDNNTSDANYSEVLNSLRQIMQEKFPGIKEGSSDDGEDFADLRAQVNEGLDTLQKQISAQENQAEQEAVAEEEESEGFWTPRGHYDSEDGVFFYTPLSTPRTGTEGYDGDESLDEEVPIKDDDSLRQSELGLKKQEIVSDLLHSPIQKQANSSASSSEVSKDKTVVHDSSKAAAQDKTAIGDEIQAQEASAPDPKFVEQEMLEKIAAQRKIFEAQAKKIEHGTKDGETVLTQMVRDGKILNTEELQLAVKLDLGEIIHKNIATILAFGEKVSIDSKTNPDTVSCKTADLFSLLRELHNKGLPMPYKGRTIDLPFWAKPFLPTSISMQSNQLRALLSSYKTLITLAEKMGVNLDQAGGRPIFSEGGEEIGLADFFLKDFKELLKEFKAAHAQNDQEKAEESFLTLYARLVGWKGSKRS